MNVTDDHVLELVNLKKKDGYKYLYDSFFPSLCRFSYRITKNISESEDLIQELFVRMWKSDVKFYSKRSLVAYLYLSAKNASLNALRNNKFDNKSENPELKQLNVANGDPSIQQIMVEEEVHRQVYMAIKALSPERRNIILMSMEGLTNSEIAKVIGVSINTVKTLKLKSYRTLRDSLRPAFYTLFF